MRRRPAVSVPPSAEARELAHRIAFEPPLVDLAVLPDCLIVLLEIDGNDVLLDEAQRTAQGMLRAVSDETLRSTFLASVGGRSPRVAATE